MRVENHPALQDLLSELGQGMQFGQLSIRPVGSGFEVRHERDDSLDSGELHDLEPSDMRDLAQTNSFGAFRPLKSAPDIRWGWVCHAENSGDLAQALDALYPGALADWHAWRQRTFEPTSFRDFLNRQTGMYRIAQTLSDERACEVVRSACRSEFCLKRRLWADPSGVADEAPTRESIPCFEPCALVLEYARVVGRMDREDKVTMTFAPGELETLKCALEQCFENRNESSRAADFGSPGNAQRLRMLLERVRAVTPVKEGESAP